MGRVTVRFRVSFLRPFLLACVLTGLLVTPAYAFTTGQSASLVIGQTDFVSGSANEGGSTSPTGLDTPFGLAFDSAGNLWSVDFYNSRVLRFSPPFANGMAANLVIGQSTFTANTGATTQTGLNRPFGLAFYSAGNLWVSDFGNNRVLRFSPPFSNGMAANLVIGQSTFGTSASVTSQTGLHSPSGLVIDSAGNLWVSDQSNQRVLRFSSPFSNGMAANLVIGQSTFTTGGGALTQTGLGGPTGLAFDSAGNLWVADGGYNRVLRYTPAFANGMAANLVIGQSTFTTNTGATTQTGLYGPTGLAFDSTGNLWVAEEDNNRVMRFSPSFSSGMAASLVIGQSTFTTKTGATTQAGLNSPDSLVVDALGNLWVADTNNNRLLMFAGSTGLSGFLLQLQAGWNLISLPVVPSQPAIGKLLLPLVQLHELVIVWSFTPPSTWTFYNPGPPVSGTLTTMVDGKGYWVNVKDAVNMTVVGYVIVPGAVPPSYSLAAGWNLVGFKPQPTIQNETVTTYLTSVSGKYSSVWVFDNLNATWIKGTGSVQLAPGEGMWIYVTIIPATLLP